jgi:hypothetical protein
MPLRSRNAAAFVVYAARSARYLKKLFDEIEYR